MSELSGILSLLFIVAAFVTSCSNEPPDGRTSTIVEFMSK